MDQSLFSFAFQIIILIFSVVIHEVSHGYAALALGDTTAQDEGRLTLNPLPHIDPFGSIIFPLLQIIFPPHHVFLAWARPVPYNPYRLRNQKWGSALVGIAGPIANLALALFFGLLLRFLPLFSGVASAPIIYNFATIAATICLLNIALAVFNLIPIPPLDGSKVLFSVLPHSWRGVQNFLEQYGFFVLIFFIFFLSDWIFPMVLSLFAIVTGTNPF